MSLLSAIARAFSMIAGLRHANAALGRAARREIAALKPLTRRNWVPVRAWCGVRAYRCLAGPKSTFFHPSEPDLGLRVGFRPEVKDSSQRMQSRGAQSRNCIGHMRARHQNSAARNIFRTSMQLRITLRGALEAGKFLACSNSHQHLIVKNHSLHGRSKFGRDGVKKLYCITHRLPARLGVFVKFCVVKILSFDLLST